MTDKKIYTTVLGNTWDSISYKLYKNSEFQDRLIALNLKYVDVALFMANEKIVYEDIEQVDYITTAPWR